MRRSSLAATVLALLGVSAGARAEGPARADEYRPLLSYRFKDLELQAPILAAARGEGVSGFPVDRDRNSFRSGLALSPLLRVGLRLESVKPLAGKFPVLVEYEHDLPTGTWTSETPIAGEGLPNSTALTTQLRKAWARLSVGPYLHVGGGLMTSHWGLGLVANDGAHRWEPGSARFTDPRGGTLVTRAFVGTGPLTSARFTSALAVEQVRSDNALLDGDSAYQLIATVLVGQDRPTQGGYFLVHRHQSTADGRVLDVDIADVAGKVTVDLHSAKLTLEAESALIFGRTTLAASPEIPRSNVLQLGAVLRASLAFKRAGGVLDLLYASGDGNTHDAQINGFHADPNFETGLLLFRYVQAAQTGRGYGTGADSQLVGAPPVGLERLPTRGGLTNAVVAFPRVWVRPVRGLETYGGVLVAIAPSKNVDPFNTDVAGGSPRNALNGAPGSYWGTEIDLGVRYRRYIQGTELTFGTELGVLFPGSALGGVAGYNLEPVYGGRLMVTYRL